VESRDSWISSVLLLTRNEEYDGWVNDRLQGHSREILVDILCTYRAMGCNDNAFLFA